jgi:uncharacterized protein (DUF58 family)
VKLLIARLREWLARVFKPPRTIRPTREGWWMLLAAVGLGFAAMNTGNNLLYLLVSMLLGLIVVSGVLSERSIRGLSVAVRGPDEIFADRPALFGAAVVNRKTWAVSYSVTLEILGRGQPPRLVYVPRLGPGEEHLFTWEETLPQRGRHRLPGIRITTLFPFGLFLKAGQPIRDSEVIVYPAVRPVSPERLAESGAGDTTARRRGRGSDLYNLRDYRAGDDPRLIHWRSSAKAGALMVRELEAETTADTRIVLDETGTGDPDRLEAALSEAASLAARLLRSGSAVELMGPGILVALGRGRPHERRILTALALYEPGARVPAPAPGRSGPSLREIRVPL